MMSDMSGVRIHGYLVSTWTRTAVMTCIEKGIEHELVPIAYGSDAHAALHPFRRIPVLEHDGVVITESLAITGYLDEAFPGPALQPSEMLARRRMRHWMSVCGDYVFRDVVRAIPRGRDASAEVLATARGVLIAVDALIGVDPWLAGDELTLADLYLAPQISNAREKAPAVVAGLAALDAWSERVAARDSFLLTAYEPATIR